MSEIDLTVTQARQYKDVSLSFARNPVTHDVLAVSGTDAVFRAIKSIIRTEAGEAPFFPGFGSRLSGLLFEPIDPLTTFAIMTEIKAVIAAFEPRVQIVGINVKPSEDELKYQIDLTLAIINLPEPITLTLFLTRLR